MDVLCAAAASSAAAVMPVAHPGPRVSEELSEGEETTVDSLGGALLEPWSVRVSSRLVWPFRFCPCMLLSLWLSLWLSLLLLAGRLGLVGWLHVSGGGFKHSFSALLSSLRLRTRHKMPPSSYASDPSQNRNPKPEPNMKPNQAEPEPE